MEDHSGSENKSDAKNEDRSSTEESSKILQPDLSDHDNNGPQEKNEKASDSGSNEKSLFKMPAIIPRFSVNKTSAQEFQDADKKTRKAVTDIDFEAENDSEEPFKAPPPIVTSSKVKKQLSPAERLKESPIPYKEPPWGGLSDKSYSFEVVKNGTVVDTLALSLKSFHVFGRLPSCDYPMEHPSLSRYHAVVQYCSKKTDTFEEGWYLYDLDSTHGTWVNKIKIKPRIYTRLRVGHVMKLGGSSRLMILQGPEEDVEAESELSVTELKQQREKQKKEVELLKAAYLAEQASQKAALASKTSDGCSWGMDADDAIEVNQENPFAVLEPQNEDLYIEDPKKALKGYFEREGLDLPEYKVDEEGRGSYRCSVELPIDAPNGQPIIAEATVSGKKREAVVACALEACRILDKKGELRKSHHESRKRKPKDWADNDYYDSDDDTFLDRTGDIEKKREKRLKKAQAKKEGALTYTELKKNLDEVEQKIEDIQKQLDKAKSNMAGMEEGDGSGIDALDAFMASIKSGAMDTKTKLGLKKQLFSLRTEHQRLVKLVNIAKPPDLPPLTALNMSGKPSQKKSLPLFGKMRGPSKDGMKPSLPAPTPTVIPKNDEEEEEEEEDEEEEMKREKTEEKEAPKTEGKSTKQDKEDTMDTSDKDKLNPSTSPKMTSHKTEVKGASSIQARIQRLLGPAKPPELPKQEDATPEDSTQKQEESEASHNVQKSVVQTTEEGERKESSMEEDKQEDFAFEPEKKKSKRKPRIRKPKVAQEEAMSADYDASDPNYATWLPPQDQSGDGKTSLNAKYGY